MSSRSLLITTGLLLAVVAIAGGIFWFAAGERMMSQWRKGDSRLSVKGIVWQIDYATANPDGNWQELGADSLLVQWTDVDGVCFIGCPPKGGPVPNWLSISRQPWAKNVILGLASYHNEPRARADVLALAKKSEELTRRDLPINIKGYYFPVEVDPSWQQAPELMKQALAGLPRPLWISVYEGYNIGGKALADWLAEWLPADVGVFFQDGVGVEARSPAVARQYADELVKKLGAARVKVIIEAFRPLGEGKFRAATPEEFLPQIRAMQGYDTYIFDGPHYVDHEFIEKLKQLAKG